MVNLSPLGENGTTVAVAGGEYCSGGATVEDTNKINEVKTIKIVFNNFNDNMIAD